MNEAFAARKKVGKTWGKVKRASGIQKSKSNPLEDDSQHEDTSFDNSRNAYRAELVSFYTEFNPEKLPEVDQILDAYEGRESDLMEKLFAIRDQQRQQPRPAPPPPPPPPSHPLEYKNQSPTLWRMIANMKILPSTIRAMRIARSLSASTLSSTLKSCQRLTKS